MKTKIFWLVLLVFVILLGGAFYFMGKSDDGWNWPQVSGCKTMPKQEVSKVSNKIYNGDGFTFEYSPDYILENNTLWTAEGYDVLNSYPPECETCLWDGISIEVKNDVDFELGSEDGTMEKFNTVLNVNKIYGSRFSSAVKPDYNYGYVITMEKFDGLIYYVQSGTKVVSLRIDGNMDLLARSEELRKIIETVKFE